MSLILFFSLSFTFIMLTSKFSLERANGVKIHCDINFVSITLKPLHGSTLQSIPFISQFDGQVACMELEEVVILVLQDSDQ